MKFVGGRLCLDFVNTVDAWVHTAGTRPSRDYGDTAMREKLVDYDALVHWARLAAVLSGHGGEDLLKRARRHRADASATLARGLRLRLALYRIFKSSLERWAPERGDLEALHEELAVARSHERVIHRDGVFLWTWDESPGAMDRILWPVLRSAVDLLTCADLGKLRQCKGDECGWLFLDSSRNRSRSWCDMKDCGNLSKVRRFRMRR